MIQNDKRENYITKWNRSTCKTSRRISKINLNVDGKTVNAKSILGIMSLGIKANTEIEIECDGEDEKEAMEKILEAFNNKFGE